MYMYSVSMSLSYNFIIAMQLYLAKSMIVVRTYTSFKLGHLIWVNILKSKKGHLKKGRLVAFFFVSVLHVAFSQLQVHSSFYIHKLFTNIITWLISAFVS